MEEEGQLDFGNSTSGNFTGTIELFQYYFTPVLVYLGSVGNGISVYVFFATKLRKLSSSYYLAALAISDNIFLCMLFFLWLSMVGVDVYNKPVMCQIMNYLTGVCSFLSVWLVFAFTVERFVAVRYPLLRQSMCTVSRAKTVIIALVVLAMGLYSPQAIFSTVTTLPNENVRHPTCYVDPEWKEFINIFNYFDTLITFIIPVVVIIYLNICISRTIWKLSSVRRKLTHRETPAGLHMRKTPHRVARQRRNPTSQNKVTKMLLVVSTACLCLHFPSYVMRVIADLIQVSMGVFIGVFQVDVIFVPITLKGRLSI